MRINKSHFYDEKKSSVPRIILGCMAALLCATVVVGGVLWANKDRLVKKSNVQTNKEATAIATVVPEDSEEVVINTEGRTSDELDFWNMYDSSSANHSQKSNSEKPKSDSKKADTESSSVILAEETETKSGSSSAVVTTPERQENTFNAADSGDEERVEIFEDMLKNNYMAENFSQDGNELQYFRSNRKISSYGIDVSKYQGDIDWEKVAASGVDFAMIRMGVRGYSTGTVVVDETFEANITGALDNNIEVGIYFYSQAITAEEAVEEANYAVIAASKYKLTYPIVFYSENITNDTARTDELTADELSAIAGAFCDTVERYGYKSMICASKHQLSVNMDVSELENYDVWLIDAPNVKEGEKLNLSEYPYQYVMWQYASNGKIDGINGSVDLNISFIDYKYR